jgi:hypothetical protein
MGIFLQYGFFGGAPVPEGIPAAEQASRFVQRGDFLGTGQWCTIVNKKLPFKGEERLAHRSSA